LCIKYPVFLNHQCLLRRWRCLTRLFFFLVMISNIAFFFNHVTCYLFSIWNTLKVMHSWKRKVTEWSNITLYKCTGYTNHNHAFSLPCRLRICICCGTLQLLENIKLLFLFNLLIFVFRSSATCSRICLYKYHARSAARPFGSALEAFLRNAMYTDIIVIVVFSVDGNSLIKTIIPVL
jgi:hypothetical protein